MRKAWYIALTAAVVLATAGCSTQKNTAQSRWWHSLNAHYNTYFNGQQAFIDGNLEKEKSNKDNFTEQIPLYPVGNKNSRDIGKSNYERAIEKAEKAIKMHSIKTKPEWKSGKAKTPKDREWLGRKEYNPFIWRAWMLLGKAQFQMGAFDEAAATFSYMSRMYPTQPRQNGLARAWLAKCYTELGWLYDAEDVIRNMSRDSVDFRTVKDWDYTYADYYLHKEEWPQAAVFLRKAIRHERRNKQRAREWFLMGQIQQKMGHRKEAEKAFRKVIGCHPPYELEFNARIAQTEVMAAGNAKSVISRLKRMAANDNNKDYLDQVYYAIGNIHLAQNDTVKAIAAYEKGNEKSTRNGIEKGVLLLTLGNLYWEKERYGDAQRCYGEAIGLLDQDRPDYKELSNRSKVLDELVPHTEAVHLQDSLLALSLLPEAELNKVIDRIISDLKKKEKEEQRARQEAEAAANAPQNPGFAGNTGKMGNTNTPSTPTTGNSQWYFYNPIAVSQGKNTFERQWGKRQNIDNWQRINQTVVSQEEPENTEEEEQSDEPTEQGEQKEGPKEGAEGTAAADTLANDPHNREYYLAQIPFSEEQKAASHDIIKPALLQSGIIFKDKLENLKLSEKQLLRLISQYADYEHNDEAWYHLYLIYARRGRQDLCDNCLSHLKADYPESPWTTLLDDPYYFENAQFGEHIEDSLYAATYQAFKKGKTEIIKSNVRLSEERFPMGENRAKFIFIDGLSRLNEGDGKGCLDQMKTVVEKYPQSEVSEMAGMIIKGVQEGRRLYGGKFAIDEIWLQRDSIMPGDSTVVDTLSSERNQEFVFMLIYHPDSVSENQLLYEMARYNFTNFLVRNFEITIDEDHGIRRMLFSGFLNYDEALQYARQLFADKNMAERLEGCRNLIISSANLPLLGTRFSYDDYEQFYEETFVPMKISDEKLLIKPTDIQQTDPEDISGEEKTENEQPDDMPASSSKSKKTVEDFDFGDDFW